jgi:hypothetical protein
MLSVSEFRIKKELKLISGSDYTTINLVRKIRKCDLFSFAYNRSLVRPQEARLLPKAQGRGTFFPSQKDQLTHNTNAYSYSYYSSSFEFKLLHINITFAGQSLCTCTCYR